jgi:outer membrane protein OmpA-like peptidoglycan-associated protein/tetratricopeptide (TPR) repeat protein
MKIKYLFAVLFLFPLSYSTYSFAQEDEEDEACMEPDKKVMKLIAEGEDGKNDKRERLEAFIDATKEAPGNAYVYYAMANYNYDRAENVMVDFEAGRANYAQIQTAYMAAAKAYEKVIEYCPSFHSEPYYKLGAIYLMFNDKSKATQYFRSFLEFDERDPAKYEDDYGKKKKDVEERLPEMAFFEEFFQNMVPFKPTKVEFVSSPKDEYLPMISPDNELIFYTRKGESDAPQGIVSPVIEKFTLSQRPGVHADFDGGSPLAKPFNTTEYLNYGGVSLSLDNKEMFICACQEVEYQAHANCDIYRTTFERSGKGGNDFIWTPLENLGSAVNTRDGWEAQPTLSADGNTLYFATWRAGSQLTDIYYSNRKKDGSWTTAQPVDGPINSPGHDKAPFLHQDSETLYFVSDCSDERKGAGGSDIFYSRQNEDGAWQTPINIGYPINSEGNEVGLVVSTDGHLAYYTTRNANSEGFDIFYFELYEEARPQKVQFYKGQVKDEDGEPVKDAVVEVSYKDSKENVEIKVNGDDGKFAAIVKADKPQDVMISIKKEGYSFDSELIKKEELIADNKTYIKGIEMEIDTIEVGKAFTIDDILFATDSWELSEDSKFILDQFVKFLNTNSTVKVTIQGHTDDIGDAGHNKTLSANRAKAVLDYIAENGVDKSRLKSEGYGESKPKVPNNSASNRAKNRRTDFFINAY